MKFLVEMTAVESGDDAKTMKTKIETQVFPSFERIIGWEKEKKIVGGLPVGERRLVYVLDAASNEEADSVIKSLPIWGMVTTKVTPLTTFEKRLAGDKELIKHLG